MKNIVFRGKRISDGEWVTGGYYHGECHNLSETDDVYIIPSYDSYGGDFRLEQVMPETVGQYVGFSDMNGTPVFEGDILQAKDWQISYMYGQYQFIHDIKQCAMLKLYVDQYEVIGNVHDDPELLKGDWE